MLENLISNIIIWPMGTVKQRKAPRVVCKLIMLKSKEGGKDHGSIQLTTIADLRHHYTIDAFC